MKVEFKDFILDENRAYFGQRLGDILNALQDLSDNSKGLGTRQLVRNSEGIVNQIRRILHTHWPAREEHNLKRLQKVGVAIMKAIEEKDDLEGILQGASGEMQGMLGDLDQPLNKLASPEGEETPKDDQQDQMGEPQGPPPQQAPQAPQVPQVPQAPQAPGMMPMAGGVPGQPGVPPVAAPIARPMM
jgi:hypothetical protein